MARRITAQDLHRLITGRQELAVLDVREAGRFGVDHLIAAVPCPYSELETSVAPLVPRRSVAVAVIGESDTGPLAAERLAQLGYGDVRLLDGGMNAWRAAGFTAFKGVNVPSKAFGEVLEHARDTAAIDPADLDAMRDQGPVVVLDGRTPEEHRTMCIPGALSVPNGDLLVEVTRLAPDPATPIIVHCAGRTRSIVGAQTLKDAGIPNPVFALRGGTMAWRISGRALQTGAAGVLPPGPSRAHDAARLAAGILAPHGDVTLKFGALEAVDRTARTVFLIDVRPGAAYLAGHLPGSVSAPGGQLVQATDQWIGVLNALVVLIDEPPHARAAFAVHWLRQMGHDARILTEAPADAFTATGTPASPRPYPDIAAITPADLAHWTGTILDVSPGMTFRAGHIPGARWANRSALPADLVVSSDAVAVVANDEARARLVAADLIARGPRGRDVRVLAGGHAAWVASGHALAASPDDPPDAACIDHLFWVAKRHLGDDDHARDYLAWEGELPGLVAQDATWPYRLLP